MTTAKIGIKSDNSGLSFNSSDLNKALGKDLRKDEMIQNAIFQSSQPARKLKFGKILAPSANKKIIESSALLWTERIRR